MQTPPRTPRQNILHTCRSLQTLLFDGEPTEAPRRAPETPRSARISPEKMPLGLSRSDFHTLHLLDCAPLTLDRRSLRNLKDRTPASRKLHQEEGMIAEQVAEEDTHEAAWTPQDDRILVELVLEKLTLTKEAWLDCAKSLGRDRRSVHTRWKTLVKEGDVGVKSVRGVRRRPRLPSGWR